MSSWPKRKKKHRKYEWLFKLIRQNIRGNRKKNSLSNKRNTDSNYFNYNDLISAKDLNLIGISIEQCVSIQMIQPKTIYPYIIFKPDILNIINNESEKIADFNGKLNDRLKHENQNNNKTCNKMLGNYVKITDRIRYRNIHRMSSYYVHNINENDSNISDNDYFDFKEENIRIQPKTNSNNTKMLQRKNKNAMKKLYCINKNKNSKEIYNNDKDANNVILNRNDDVKMKVIRTEDYGKKSSEVISLHISDIFDELKNENKNKVVSNFKRHEKNGKFYNETYNTSSDLNYNGFKSNNSENTDEEKIESSENDFVDITLNNNAEVEGINCKKNTNNYSDDRSLYNKSDNSQNYNIDSKFNGSVSTIDKMSSIHRKINYDSFDSNVTKSIDSEKKENEGKFQTKQPVKWSLSDDTIIFDKDKYYQRSLSLISNTSNKSDRLSRESSIESSDNDHRISKQRRVSNLVEELLNQIYDHGSDTKKLPARRRSCFAFRTSNNGLNYSNNNNCFNIKTNNGINPIDLNTNDDSDLCSTSDRKSIEFLNLESDLNNVLLDSTLSDEDKTKTLLNISVPELKLLVALLKHLIIVEGDFLARQLRRRDSLMERINGSCDILTAHLQALSPKRSEDTSLKFSVTPTSSSESGFNQWLAGMKMVAQLPEGIPQEFRRTLWLTLAEKHLAARGVDWAQAQKICFNEWTNPDDEELGVQIVKDLHRTGCSLFCGASGQHNQALLRRVLLAYARWNKAVGYCQGFNMLGALILQVMDRSEADSFKVMIYLIEGVLPESYFANNLRGLSVDMAVFRDLLRLKLPVLSKHLEQLQSDSKDSGTSYEPPLTNVFTMQWFLTLFCNCLPQETVLRVWDLVFLEGNSVLLRTALAIWNTLSDRILSVESADEFYSIMGVLTREMLEFGLMDTNNLVKAIVSINLPELNEMRERYMYNITPWTQSVSTVARRGLRLFYTDEDTDTDEDEEKIAIATAYAFFRSPKRKTDGSSSASLSGSSALSGQGSQQSPSRQVHTLQSERERVVMDISALKKQYSKLRERQRQAHIILTAACGGQSIVGPSPGPAMNHLLLGKSALVNNRGRRLGPPAGSVPPRSTSAKPNQAANKTGGETLHWKDTAAEGRKSKSQIQQIPPAEFSSTPDSASPPTSSCSSRRSSSSSTSTELCDEPGRMSDSDSLSDCYTVPPVSSSSVRKQSLLPECTEDSAVNFDDNEYTKAEEEEGMDVFESNDSMSDKNNKIISEPMDIVSNGKSKKEFPEQELDKVLFPFDRDYLTKYGSEDSSDMCISSCPASPCIYADELRHDNDSDLNRDLTRTSLSSHNIGDIYCEDIMENHDDEIICCDDGKIELVSNMNQNDIQDNAGSSPESVIQKNQMKIPSSATYTDSFLTNTTFRDSHSFHDMLSFSENRTKGYDKDKRKSLQYNYQNRISEDQDLELRKIWLETCKESKIKFDENNIYRDSTLIGEDKQELVTAVVTPEKNILEEFDMQNAISIELKNSGFDESNITNTDETCGIISDGNIFINTNVEDSLSDSNIDIELKINRTQSTSDEENRTEKQLMDSNKLEVLLPSSNQSSDIEDDNSVKESQTTEQQPIVRRGSEVQLNQILKENLEIIQKIQHTRRQKLSTSPNNTKELNLKEQLNLDDVKIKDDIQEEKSHRDENIFDNLFTKSMVDHSDHGIIQGTTKAETSINSIDYPLKTTNNKLLYKKVEIDSDIQSNEKNTTAVVSVNFKDHKSETTIDRLIKADKTNETKDKHYKSFTDDKSNSTISLTDVSSTDVSSMKNDGSTDIETSFESSFDNPKINSNINSDKVESADTEINVKREGFKQTSYRKKDYFSSTSSTSEDIDPKLNFCHFKDYKYDHTSDTTFDFEKSTSDDSLSTEILLKSSKYKDVKGDEEVSKEYRHEFHDADVNSDEKFKKYKGKSFHFERNYSSETSDAKILPRLKQYYSFDYSPKTKISDTSFYDLSKRRTSYSLDSGSDLPIQGIFNSIEGTDKRRNQYSNESITHESNDKLYSYTKNKSTLPFEDDEFRGKHYQFDNDRSIKKERKFNYDDIGATASNYSSAYTSERFSKSPSLSDNSRRNEDYNYRSEKLFDEDSDDFLSKYITRKEDLSFKFSSPPRLESTGYSMDSYVPYSSSPTKLQRSESLDTNEYLRSKSPRNIRRSLSPRYDLGKTLEECSDDFEKWKLERLSRDSGPKSRSSPISRRTLDESSENYDKKKTEFHYSRDSSPKSRDSEFKRSVKSYCDSPEKFETRWRSTTDSRESSPKLGFSKRLNDISNEFDSSPTKLSRESSPSFRESRFGKTLDEVSDDFGLSSLKHSRESSPRSRDPNLRKPFDDNLDDFDKSKYSYSHSRESSPKSYLHRKLGEASVDYDIRRSSKDSKESSPKTMESNLNKMLDENSDDFEKWKSSKLIRETGSDSKDVLIRSESVVKSNETSPKRSSSDILSRNASPKSFYENEKSLSSFRHVGDNDYKEDRIFKKKQFDDFSHKFSSFESSSTLEKESKERNFKNKTMDDFGDLEEVNESIIVLSKSKTLDNDYKTSSIGLSFDEVEEKKIDESDFSQRKINSGKISPDLVLSKTSKSHTRSERRSTIHEYQYDRIFSPTNLNKKLKGSESMDSGSNEDDFLSKTKKDSGSLLLDNDEFYTKRQQESNNLINKNKDIEQSSSTEWKSSINYQSLNETTNCDTSKKQQFTSSSSAAHGELNFKTKQASPKVTSPNSPTRFNPFPSRTSTRQPKEIGIRLGLYSPTKPSDKPSGDKNETPSKSSNISRKTT